MCTAVSMAFHASGERDLNVYFVPFLPDLPQEGVCLRHSLQHNASGWWWRRGGYYLSWK